MILGVRGPTARTLAEEDGNLSFCARPRDRRTAARRDAPCQDIAYCIARLAAEEPCREHCIRLLDQPRHDQRAPREQDDDHRLVGRARSLEDDLGELALLS